MLRFAVIVIYGYMLLGTMVTARACPRIMDIGVVFDSASTLDANLSVSKAVLSGFIKLFDFSKGGSKIRVSITVYDDQVELKESFGLAKYNKKSDILKAIEAIKPKPGKTSNTGLAIAYMHKTFLNAAVKRKEASMIGIVITNDHSSNLDLTKTASKQARSDNIEMYAVGSKWGVKEEELKIIAGEKDRYIVIRDRTHRFKTAQRLFEAVCNVCEQKILEIGLVIASSFNTARNQRGIDKSFLGQFLAQFHIGDSLTDTRVAAITYSSTIHTNDSFNLNTYDKEQDVLNAIHELPYRPGENLALAQAIDYMRTFQLGPRIVRPNVQKATLIVLDKDPVDLQSVRRAAVRASADNITVFSLGVTNKVSALTLLQITGSSDRVAFAKWYSMIPAAKESMTTSMCQRQFSPSIYADCHNFAVDFGVVFDSRTTLWKKTFSVAADMLVSFLQQFAIGPDEMDTRVSVIPVGSKIYPEDGFNLTAYSDYDDLKKAIKSIPIRNSSSVALSEGIRYMTDHLLTPEATRRNALKIGFIISDGKAARPKLLASAADHARKAGINLFALGIGKKVDMKELATITGRNSRTFQVTSHSQRQERERQMTNEICSVCGNRSTDVNFVFDPVGLGKAKVHWTRKFIETVVNSGTAGRFRFGVIAGEYEDVYLDQFFKPSLITSYIEKYEGQNVLEGLQKAMTSGFVSDTGGRFWARKVIVVFVDDKAFMENAEFFTQLMKESKTNEIKVFIASPSGAAADIDGDHVLNGKSAEEQARNLLDLLCPQT